MTPHSNDPSAPDDRDNGILEGAPSVETSGIGMLGTQTAHVSIVLPTEEEDDDDDVVEGDIRLDELAGGIVTIELPAAPIVAKADAPELDATDVAIDAASPEAEAVEVPIVGDDPVESAIPGAVRDGASAALPDEPPVETGFEPTGFEETGVDEPDLIIDSEPAAVRAVESEIAEVETSGSDPETETDTESTVAAVAEDARRRPADARADEKETPMNDRTERPVEPAERRDVARTVTAETPVLVSRRIGELADVSERETSDLLTADRLLDPAQIVRPEPEGVWQHLLYSVTGGKVNIGDGRRARARKALDRRISAPLPGGGARFVAVVSRKGGVGKTTVTTLLGQALADARDDRVIAVDANPDRGTLAERIARRSGKTVRDLVRERDNLRGYNDVSTIVARDETRLDVLASDTDPRIAEAFSGDEYRAVADVAAHYYSIVLTDTGTGIVHSVMGATLERADRLVVIAGRSMDEARLASETLTWLETNGYEDQVRNALVVLNMSSPGASPVRQDELEAHFRTRVRDVLRVPYDPQLATGGAIVFRDLQPATRAAARELAAKVVEGLHSVSTAA